MAAILVSGATGFIGRHLVALLQRQGHQVRGTIRAPSGAVRVPAAIETVVISDIGPETDWSEALQGVDVVIHLAALAHLTGTASRAEEEYRRVNALGTARLAEAVAQSSSVRRLILISSIAVSGSLTSGPLSERTPPAPDTPYGRSKHEGELAVQRILAGTAADWCTLRPALVYGPGNPGNMARLLRLVRLGIALPLGGIPNRRSFLYVENLVDLIVRVVESPAASRRHFVVADDEALSTTELLRLLGAAAGRPVRLFHVAPRFLRMVARCGDTVSGFAGKSVGLDSYSLERLVGSLVVDIGGTCATLGWRPPYSVAEGIRRTMVAS